MELLKFLKKKFKILHFLELFCTFDYKLLINISSKLDQLPAVMA